MNLENLFTEIRSQYFEPELPIPKISWNSRMRSCAGRFTPVRKILKNIEPCHIEVASYLRTVDQAEKHIRDTLTHEMIHYYLWWKNRPFGHNREFHVLLKKTGATRFNPVPLSRPVKHWYACVNCQKKYPARRLLSNVACLDCCKKYNRGQYHAKFRLEISTSTNQGIPKSKSEAIFLTSEELTRRAKDLIKSILLG